MNWILVAVFTWNSAITVPSYKTREECEAARLELLDKIKPMTRENSTACIKGPQP